MLFITKYYKKQNKNSKIYLYCPDKNMFYAAVCNVGIVLSSPNFHSLVTESQYSALY